VGSVVVGNQRCASGLKDGLDSGGVADNAETIPKAGGIEAVIGGMKAHEESADVQKKGCSVLHTLGWGGARFSESQADHDRAPKHDRGSGVWGFGIGPGCTRASHSGRS